MGDEDRSYASLEELRAAGDKGSLRTIDAPVTGLGVVRVREITGGEAVQLARLCHQKNPATGHWELDIARYNTARAAAALVEPSLGSTLEEKLAQIQTIENLGSVAHGDLLMAVEEACSGLNPMTSAVEELLQRLTDIETLLFVLAEKGGWFADARDKGLSEIREWAAFYLEKRRAECAATEKAIAAATKG